MIYKYHIIQSYYTYIQLKNGSRFSSMSYEQPEPIYGSTTASSTLNYGSTGSNQPGAGSGYGTGQNTSGKQDVHISSNAWIIVLCNKNGV